MDGLRVTAHLLMVIGKLSEVEAVAQNFTTRLWLVFEGLPIHPIFGNDVKSPPTIVCRQNKDLVLNIWTAAKEFEVGRLVIICGFGLAGPPIVGGGPLDGIILLQIPIAAQRRTKLASDR